MNESCPNNSESSNNNTTARCQLPKESQLIKCEQPLPYVHYCLPRNQPRLKTLFFLFTLTNNKLDISNSVGLFCYLLSHPSSFLCRLILIHKMCSYLKDYFTSVTSHALLALFNFSNLLILASAAFCFALLRKKNFFFINSLFACLLKELRVHRSDFINSLFFFHLQIIQRRKWR